jgi:hypothetical protein
MKSAYASTIIGNQSAPFDVDAQGNLQKLHPDLVDLPRVRPLRP